jgi:quinohemoprotein ethanol dehydrogenase
MVMALGKPQQTSVGNPNRLLVFKLQELVEPHSINALAPVPQLPQLKISREEIEGLIETGEKLYERNCGFCHGISAEGSAVVPDLRYMDETTHRDFQAIVLAGLKSHKGMVGFYETLSSQEVDAVHTYVISRNQALQDSSEWSYWDHTRYWFWYFLAWLGDRYPWLANATL